MLVFLLESRMDGSKCVDVRKGCEKFCIFLQVFLSCLQNLFFTSAVVKDCVICFKYSGI